MGSMCSKKRNILECRLRMAPFSLERNTPTIRGIAPDEIPEVVRKRARDKASQETDKNVTVYMPRCEGDGDATRIGKSLKELYKMSMEEKATDLAAVIGSLVSNNKALNVGDVAEMFDNYLYDGMLADSYLITAAPVSKMPHACTTAFRWPIDCGGIEGFVNNARAKSPQNVIDTVAHIVSHIATIKYNNGDTSHGKIWGQHAAWCAYMSNTPYLIDGVMEPGDHEDE